MLLQVLVSIFYSVIPFRIGNSSQPSCHANKKARQKISLHLKQHPFFVINYVVLLHFRHTVITTALLKELLARCLL